VQRGDHAAALDLHKRLLRLWNVLVGDNLPANVKYAMELQGRRGGFPRAPMPPSSEAQRAAIREAASDMTHAA
jgi:4-hydroxy-tetrahydrodipicolinate synthase